MSLNKNAFSKSTVQVGFGVLVALEPALGALAGMVLLGEMLSPRQWVAIACVIAAGAGSVLSGTEPEHGTPDDPL